MSTNSEPFSLGKNFNNVSHMHFAGISPEDGKAMYIELLDSSDVTNETEAIAMTSVRWMDIPTEKEAKVIQQNAQGITPLLELLESNPLDTKSGKKGNLHYLRTKTRRPAPNSNSPVVVNLKDGSWGWGVRDQFRCPLVALRKLDFC